MADTKVKIQSSVLLAALRKRRAALEAEHKKATEKYEADLEKWLTATRKAIEESLTKDISKFRIDGYGDHQHVAIPLRGSRPSQPTRPRFDALDREIKLLQAADDQVLTINSDDSRVQWL